MNNKKVEKIDKELDVDSSDLEEESQNVITLADKTKEIMVDHENTNREEEITEDYQYARATLKTTISSGQETLSKLLETMEDEEATPRHFEVSANLINSISAMSKDLLELQEKMNKIEGGDGKSSDKTDPKNVTNIQHNYYKTTEEVLREMEQAEDKKKE